MLSLQDITDIEIDWFEKDSGLSLDFKVIENSLIKNKEAGTLKFKILETNNEYEKREVLIRQQGTEFFFKSDIYEEDPSEEYDLVPTFEDDLITLECDDEAELITFHLYG